LRRKDLSLEQLDLPCALDRSWAAALRDLASPEFRAYLLRSLPWLDAKEPAPLLTREEFLARTTVSDK
jgi:hypothetical protein